MLRWNLWKQKKSTQLLIISRISPAAPANYGGFFDFDTKQTRLNELTRLLEDPAIWNDSQRTQEIGREKKQLEDTIVTLESMEQQLDDAR